MAEPHLWSMRNCWGTCFKYRIKMSPQGKEWVLHLLMQLHTREAQTCGSLADVKHSDRDSLGLWWHWYLITVPSDLSFPWELSSFSPYLCNKWNVKALLNLAVVDQVLIWVNLHFCSLNTLKLSCCHSGKWNCCYRQWFAIRRNNQSGKWEEIRKNCSFGIIYIVLTSSFYKYYKEQWDLCIHILCH